MKLKTYFLPGVFSLEFLIRPENPAAGGGWRYGLVQLGRGQHRNLDEFTFFWQSCVCIVALKFRGANAACAEDRLHFCIWGIDFFFVTYK